MIARLIAWRHRKARERYEKLAQEVRASFSAAGGRAAQQKAREPFRAKARQTIRELGLPEDRRLA